MLTVWQSFFLILIKGRRITLIFFSHINKMLNFLSLLFKIQIKKKNVVDFQGH